MLVQLKKAVGCDSDLQRGHLSSSILFKYECSIGQLFVPSGARVRRVALVSVSESCTVSRMEFATCDVGC